MKNKKKIILFLGAASLIAFGNYKQFTKNKAQTTMESKNSEKATSSSNGADKEGKGSERATSSTGGNTGTENNANQNSKNVETAKKIKSALQPTPAVYTQNTATELKNNKTDTNTKKKEKPEAPKTQNSKTAQQQNNINLKDNKKIKNQFKLDNTKSEAPKTTTETKSNEKATSPSESN